MRLTQFTRIPGLRHVIGQFKGGMGPANGFSGQRNFFGTQRLAVRLGCTCAVRRTLTNNGLANN